jgi:hypothetical protein
MSAEVARDLLTTSDAGEPKALLQQGMGRIELVVQLVGHFQSEPVS